MPYAIQSKMPMVTFLVPSPNLIPINRGWKPLQHLVGTGLRNSVKNADGHFFSTLPYFDTYYILSNYNYSNQI